jgi:hypothetical protein
MSHAFIWSEVNADNSQSEISREISSAGFGTNISGTWNKKLFRLKWINTNVDDIRLWIDNEFADIYTNQHYPLIKNTDNIKLLQDLGFDIRFTLFDSFIINKINADVATSSNLSSTSIGGTSVIFASTYIDGVKLDSSKVVLVKSQNLAYQNGLYRVSSQVGSGTVGAIVAEDVLIAAKIVGVGSSSFYLYSPYLNPFETAASGSTTFIWVDRTNRYALSAVQCATTANLQQSSTGLTNSSLVLDNRTLAVNDRILVKDQTTKSQNGIYFVSSLTKPNSSSLYNPYTSTDTADDYWKTAVNYINANVPVNVQFINAGVAKSGGYFRYYSAIGLTGGTASTASMKWSDATYNYGNTNVDYYYEITSGSAIGFSFDFGSNTGTLTSTPRTITNYSGIATTLSVANRILVKHYNSNYSGVYSVSNVGFGSTGLWVRASDFDTASEINQTKVYSINSRNTLGGNIWYLGKSTTYNSTFKMNFDGINVQERFYPFTYEPVTNHIVINQSDLTNVNQTDFINSGIAISQRVLVSGQTSYPAQNGIYKVASVCATVFGLEYSTDYSILRGSLATISNGTTGAGTTYFLYASGSQTAAGAVGITWVNITNQRNLFVTASTSVDKFSSTYLTPTDFDVPVAIGTSVLVNTSNELVNGVYSVSAIGTSTKQVFKYDSAISLWTQNIFSNILSSNGNGTYAVSPNLKNQISGILQVASIASTHYGEIFVPEILFPSFQNYENYFSTEGKGSSILQELDLDWFEQDYQKYNVKAVLYINSAGTLPTSAGTAISSLIRSTSGSGRTILQSNDSVLVFVGSGYSSSSVVNGVYRPTFTGIGSVYFTPHEDFYFNSKFALGSDKKSLASPYERPTMVKIDYGYLGAGTTFSYDKVYMQSEVGIRQGTFGSDYASVDLDKYLHTGSEVYYQGSEIRLNANQLDLAKFPRLAPIQHILSADTTLDTINQDILTVRRNGQQLFSNRSGDSVQYPYEVNDRIFYYVSNEDSYNSTVRKSTSGIYQIVYIDTNYNYYLRKVKYNSINGHLDFAKNLVSHSSSFGNTIYLARPESNSSVYTWSTSNYPDALLDVFVVSTGGTVINKTYSTDYTVDAVNGKLNISGSGWTGTLYAYLYRDSEIPKYNEEAKQTLNRYYYIPQILKDKAFILSPDVKLSSTWTTDSENFQVVNIIGTASTTEIKYNRDRSSWIRTFDSNKNYSSNANIIVENDSLTNYFFTSRLSEDGYYIQTGLANTSTFTGLFTDPVTLNSIGLFTGDVYLDKTYQPSGIALTSWYSGLGLSADTNVLVLKNKTTSDYSDTTIDSSFTSSYYDDINRLVTHNKSGKRDQKLYTFKRAEIQEVTLNYSSAFGSSLYPTTVRLSNSAGFGTYSLYFDPASTNITTSARSWIDVSTRSTFAAAVGNTGNIPDFNDITYIPVIGPMGAPTGSGSTAMLDGYTIQAGDKILIKSQIDSTKNGVYTAVLNNKYVLSRANDLDATSELFELGRVVYNNRTYELNLPEDSSVYNLGASALNTPLFWKSVGAEYTIDVVGVGHTNFANLNSLPDTINGVDTAQNDKILFISQSTSSENIVARINKTIQPNLIRIDSGSATTQFQISSLYVNDANRNINYELYFNPSNTSIGSDAIQWFQQGLISNFTNCAFASTTNLSLTSNLNIPGSQKGDRLLVKNQSNQLLNGIYSIDELITNYLNRHELLDNSSEISINKRVNVVGGIASSGIYALVYDETTTPALDSTNIFWTKVSTNSYLTNARVATINEVSLTNPPSKVDDIILQKYDRILVKNQTDKTANGVYVVSSIGSSNVWTRATDLDASSEILPQLSIQVGYGTTNADKNFRIKLPTPRTITNLQTTAYILGTDNIDWIDTANYQLYNSSPETWQPLSAGYDNAVFLGGAKLGVDSTAKSKSFGIAVKTPNNTVLSTNNITANGQVRNMKFKVEYIIAKD